ncbi:MMPL family transporter [Shewanella sp. 3B26]|jgi:predicted RND superfamily exporter protein|uniref:MMPL family transporter n=1 Tax=Shewanella zhuhaiensis TaxID=2919576 RepID=A0AAJ1BKD5_9GAMM|nr:MMPL family transporter [Shewanella zhuhaiensis]MCH4296408.1 MMPL family transporter [Shewanella zhuhaiensis]
MLEKLVNGFESFLFRHRGWVISLFVLLTAFLGYQASQLKMDAAFVKNIPLNHSYMQTYLKHQKDFGGANSIMVAVEDTSGNIFNPVFFDALKNVHDQLFFIPGVDRSQVKSLFSPSTRFTEVVEDGFAGGPVIPADYVNDTMGLAVVRDNIEKAGIVGRLIAEDYSAAMVSAQLMDFDPQTGEPLDTIALAAKLESELRGKFETDTIKVHIIGFAKMAGDVADGAKGVVLFFLIAIAITAVMVFLFSRSVVLTLLPLACSLMAVVWQLGLLTVVGFGLDPMSILVPFLVFAIGVSHGVQIINAVRQRVLDGQQTKAAAASAFRSLLVPGGVALLSDTVGFITLLAIDIGIIRELAISASLGVAVIIFTNLILLPVVISFFDIKAKEDSGRAERAKAFWQPFSRFADIRVAVVVLLATAGVYMLGLKGASEMKIGDLQGGAPALHADSRYNQDTFFITDHFSITTDVMTIITEAYPEACTYHDALERISEFEWQVGNTPGVESTASLASIARKVNAGFNEGNPKWEVLPRNTSSLVQAVGQIPTTSGLLNGDCSVMPVYLFLKDHKAETIEAVVAKVKAVSAELDTDKIQFKLASGPVGVMAATNEAVAEAQTPMMLYVYGAVFVLCLISFRSIRATIAVILPLYVVSTLAQALMTKLEIGLAVSTLPVIALGVGIGVDYGIYILSTMAVKLRDGMAVQQAYLEALQERGSAVIFTGLTLAIGVSTWFFSALKFQMDMGILLTFMFLVNMLGAIIILPALTALFWPKRR